ncbi:hypothetical protein K523DRAFT_257567 [Schizophyllum commune Tattone D]|nr:hypothetical protein K523DRAFT_257567 [Schizophyllum commune Tattone D]
MKRRFRILTHAPEYSLTVQAMIPPVLSALHNYIRIHDPEDTDELDLDRITPYDPSHPPDVEEFEGNEYNSTAVAREESQRANERRDRIAAELWEQYQEYLALHPDE